LKARCYDEKIEQEISRHELESQSLPNCAVSDPNNKRYTSDLNVACILDEFTTECLEYEVNLIKVTQENWQSQLRDYNIDFLLVESCWRGNDNNWGTLTKGSSGGKKLSPLLNYCKKNNIPTVFWNKEDPPHYDKFGAIAKLFDIAITTDINMVDRYKADFGIDVYPLSFGAQPKIHNPSPIIEKLEKAVFAGSYYGDKPQRCADFNDIMSQLETAKINYDIFDRNYNRNIDKFIFPERYKSHIIGTLPPEDIWKVHKGYKYQVNMNTVQNSATMFARRVYESLASGTPVISNDSIGMRELFGDLVVMPNDHLSVAEQLIQLESSPAIYNEIARLGVRRVMRHHTYGHRIQEICKLLGVTIEVSVPKAILAVTVSNEAEIIKAKNMFATQTAPSKHLFIELENFNNAYKYLNKS
ncbi:MAG: glycosyltransferase, partial [Psychrobacillus sp.]